jgi:hypothetical protein
VAGFLLRSLSCPTDNQVNLKVAIGVTRVECGSDLNLNLSNSVAIDDGVLATTYPGIKV